MQSADLSRYKSRLQDMRSRLIGEVRRLGDAVADDVQSKGDLSRVPTHMADRDSEGVETIIALEKAEGQILNEVDAALDRINAETFGQCERCSERIAPERLDAIPYAAYCVRCESERERETTGR